MSKLKYDKKLWYLKETLMGTDNNGRIIWRSEESPSALRNWRSKKHIIHSNYKYIITIVCRKSRSRLRSAVFDPIPQWSAMGRTGTGREERYLWLPPPPRPLPNPTSPFATASSGGRNEDRRYLGLLYSRFAPQEEWRPKKQPFLLLHAITLLGWFVIKWA